MVMVISTRPTQPHLSHSTTPIPLDPITPLYPIQYKTQTKIINANKNKNTPSTATARYTDCSGDGVDDIVFCDGDSIIAVLSSIPPNQTTPPHTTPFDTILIITVIDYIDSIIVMIKIMSPI